MTDSTAAVSVGRGIMKPADAILSRESRIEADPDMCIYCGTCVKFCSVKALKLE